jgi:hypothetical protein
MHYGHRVTKHKGLEARACEVLDKLHLAKCSYGQSKYMRFWTNFIWPSAPMDRIYEVLDKLHLAKCFCEQSEYMRFWTNFIWPNAPMDSQNI